MEAIKPGDWKCSNCYENNFAKRDYCRKCNTAKGNTHASFGTGQHQVEGFGHNQFDVTVKKGDWICESCSDLNFANKKVCRKCGTARSLNNAITTNNDDVVMKPGDWECYVCKDHNYARNVKCRTCGADKNPSSTVSPVEKPQKKDYNHRNADNRHRNGHSDVQMKPGDWCCSKCSTHNFAHRSACFKCNSVKC